MNIRKSVTAILVVVLLFAVAGCADKSFDPASVEYITVMSVIPDPAKYEVFVMTPDCLVKEYDFSLYWMNNAFDYFSDPLPSETEYILRDHHITESAWNNITEVLRENRFLELPEELKPVNGQDFGSYYIEVKVNGDIHKSGGYGAGYNNDLSSKSFKKTWDEIWGHMAIMRPIRY